MEKETKKKRHKGKKGKHPAESNVPSEASPSQNKSKENTVQLKPSESKEKEVPPSVQPVETSNSNNSTNVTVESKQKETAQAAVEQVKTKEQLKEERRALFEAQRAAAKPDNKLDAKSALDKSKMSKDSVDGATGQKSKADLKAERRALQEAQRAAKENKKVTTKKPDGSASSHAPKVPTRVPDNLQADLPDVEKKLVKRLVSQQIPQRTKVQKQVSLFKHLPQYERAYSFTEKIPLSGSNIHPDFIKLGVQYAEGVICGSNARCVSLVHALKNFIRDYVTPPQKELSRDLEARMKPNITFLQQCRPISVSMGNVIKFLKMHITNIPNNTLENEAKELLIEALDTYVDENITKGWQAITSLVKKKITDGDVILTYSYSSIVMQALKDAHKDGVQFEVIVVDGRPKLEGKRSFQQLSAEGIKCSYVLINALSYMMQEATKVLMGAHALLANGYVMSRIGTSQVALVAKSYNKPVLICCETYKFCERVQTDSFIFNELGDPDDLVQTHTRITPLNDWRDLKELTLLNLIYDVTPSDLISVVITDIGMIPCTSVPVVLRVKQGTDV